MSVPLPGGVPSAQHMPGTDWCSGGSGGIFDWVSQQKAVRSPEALEQVVCALLWSVTVGRFRPPGYWQDPPRPVTGVVLGDLFHRDQHP